MHHIPLKFVTDKVSGKGHRATSAGLNLTSMIDFLVTIVVALESNSFNGVSGLWRKAVNACVTSSGWISMPSLAKPASSVSTRSA